MGYLNFAKKSGQAVVGVGKRVWGAAKYTKNNFGAIATGAGVMGAATMFPTSPSKSTETDIERMQQNNSQQNQRRQL